MLKPIITTCLILAASSAHAQDAYGSYGSVPMSSQDTQAAYSLTPGTVGTQGSLDDTRLQMDYATPDRLMNATSLDATNPQNDASFR